MQTDTNGQENNDSKDSSVNHPAPDKAGTHQSHARHSHSRNQQGAPDKNAPSYDKARNAAMEVTVDNNIEKAMKVLKRKLIKEGLFKELKSRRYYEKPSEKKKRKHKESIKKARKEELRQKRNALFLS
jgi:small subunit ribosomal protein S21